MNTLEAIRSRRSVRKFQNQKVSHEVLEQIVSAAAYAPSWKNTQVARYHVLENPELQRKIAEEYTLGFSYNTGTLANAPQVVVLTAVKGRRLLFSTKSPSKQSHCSAESAFIVGFIPFLASE